MTYDGPVQPETWQTSVWTIERAQQMGLLGKDQWKKQPDAMLVARATSEAMSRQISPVARAISIVCGCFFH